MQKCIISNEANVGFCVCDCAHPILAILMRTNARVIARCSAAIAEHCDYTCTCIKYIAAALVVSPKQKNALKIDRKPGKSIGALCARLCDFQFRPVISVCACVCIRVHANVFSLDYGRCRWTEREKVNCKGYTSATERTDTHSWLAAPSLFSFFIFCAGCCRLVL